MKKLILPVLYLFMGVFSLATNGFGQNVGIGTSTPNSSARLEVNSTNQGILIPTLTTAQRNAIASPALGLLVFQTDGTPGFYYYNGAAWINLTNGNPVTAQGLAVSASYGVTTTLAGSGSQGAVNATGTAATFDGPRGVAQDAAGNVYVADWRNHMIRKINPSGVVSTFAGSGIAGATDDAGTAASFNYPVAVAVDASGNLYVADQLNHKIRKITPGGDVSTLAGNGSAGDVEGDGTVASFNFPAGVAVDAAGIVYVADQFNHKIRKIIQLPNGTSQVSTLAGSGNTGSANGTGTAASFDGPGGIATDAAGNVYVSEYFTNLIRKITPSPGGGVVTTLAGNGGSGAVDGIGAAASFNRPSGLATDAAGNVYVADSQGNKIRKITPGGAVSTLAGSGSAGSTDATGSSAAFNQPDGVAVDASGNVLVADTGSNKIRKIIAW